MAVSEDRVVSGMRPSGRLHLGHYHGVLKNWVRLQNEHDCYFFIADWHALTTVYDDVSVMSDSVWDMVVDWLAAGIDPSQSVLFCQSLVPQHAELHLLLSMISPLGWLERVPTYKEQQEKLSGKDLSTYGFLGYPVLQSADILIYRASGVPVGEDQVPHVELTREIARRFNHLFGREAGFEQKAQDAIVKLGKRPARQYNQLRQAWLEKGEENALNQARELIEGHGSMTLGDKERLLGYLEGGGRVILPEPQAHLTEAARMPGLDGQKMSKSYGNTIALRDTPDRIEREIKAMPTDPARVRRDDPGDPDKCPVFDLHKVYSDRARQDWVRNGCTSAGIGCIDCKRPLIDAIVAEQEVLQERAKPYEEDREAVKRIIIEGSEQARDAAEDTMKEVRRAVGLDHLR